MRIRLSVMQKFLLLAIVPIVLYVSLILFWVVPRVDQAVQSIEEQQAKAVLDKITLLVEKTGEDLVRYREDALRRHKQELKDLVDIVHSMLLKAANDINTSSNAQHRKKAILDYIKSMRYAGDNYLFAIDYNNTMLAHPYIPAGTPMQEVYDIKGEPIVPKIVSVARRYGEGFTRYWWKRNNNDATPYEKLTYSRNCPKWHMVIGTGIYLEDIRKEVERRKKELLSRLRTIMQQTKIGKSGYIYVFDKDKMIIHPNSNINGKNFKKLPNPGKGTYIYDDLVKAAKTTGVLRYYWDKPSDKGHYVYEKISWIKYIPSMKLYVVSSAYVDELNAISDSLSKEIVYLAGAILVLTLLWTLYYVHKLFYPIKTLKDTASVIAKGDYTRRISIPNKDEIGDLGRCFNLMVDRLENHINHLDEIVQKKTEAIRKLAVTDALTDLYNRRYFLEASAKLFELGKRENTPLSVVMLDIDHFKRINDTYGHQTGDRVIQALAATMKKTIRDSDIACRYGGEEFVLLLPSTTAQDALTLAQRLKEQVARQSIHTDGATTVTFTVSLGIAEADYTNDKNIEDTLRRADIALYEAKHNGRNRTEVWDERTPPSS